MARPRRCRAPPCPSSRSIPVFRSSRSSVFAGCDLRDADLRDCDLTEAELTFQTTGDHTDPTDLTGALLDGADLTDVTVERVVGWPAG